jgi:hypothetical protein
MFASCLMMGKAPKHSQNCEPDLASALSQAPCLGIRLTWGFTLHIVSFCWFLSQFTTMVQTLQILGLVDKSVTHFEFAPCP